LIFTQFEYLKELTTKALKGCGQ